MALVFSCQELPDLQELNKLVPDAKIVFFNLRLDTLRGDLGLPAFPPKVILFVFVALGVSVETKRRAWWGLSRAVFGVVGAEAFRLIFENWTFLTAMYPGLPPALVGAFCAAWP